MIRKMKMISVVEEELPPGFRFHPKDEELVCDYLLKKVTAAPQSDDSHDLILIIEVDLNKCEPWDIPQIACVGGKEFYFYSRRDKKYPTGTRTNRATASGYWKATGKDRPILRKGTLVGMRKTLVFYQGRAPKGERTDWVMHEFRLEGPVLGASTSLQDKEDWVLCRVFDKKREVCTSQISVNQINCNEMGIISSSCFSNYDHVSTRVSSKSSSASMMEDYSYINFDHIYELGEPNNDLDDDHGYINNLLNHYQQQQVSCFSLFS